MGRIYQISNIAKVILSQENNAGDIVKSDFKFSYGSIVTKTA